MKLTATARALNDALDMAEQAADRSKYPVVPSLGRVLIDASERDDLLTITGTDLRFRAWRTARAVVSEMGAVCLVPKELGAFLDAVPDDAEVTLTVDDKYKAVLKAPGVTAKMAGMDPEQFPAAPSFDAPSTDLTLDAKVLASLISSTAHAARTEATSTDNVLDGVLLRVRGGTLTLVGCDGYRLGLRSAEIGDAADVDVIVHALKLAEVGKRLASATSARLVVDAERKSVLIDSEAGSWSVALIDGTYPDYTRIIPRADAAVTTITLNRAELLRASDLVRTVSDELKGQDGKVTRTVQARLSIARDGLTITARDTSRDAEVTAELAIKLDGEPLDLVSFNGVYLRDAIRTLEGDRVTLELVGKASAGLVREAGERNGHLQVVMPMHVARP